MRTSRTGQRSPFAILLPIAPSPTKPTLAGATGTNDWVCESDPALMLVDKEWSPTTAMLERSLREPLRSAAYTWAAMAVRGA
jgi:hypothetical protein